MPNSATQNVLRTGWVDGETEFDKHQHLNFKFMSICLSMRSGENFDQVHLFVWPGNFCKKRLCNINSRRAGYFGFAVLQCTLKSYLQANLIIK